MITADQIPDEAVDALHSSLADDGDTLTEVWDCRVAIAAAVSAWPGVEYTYYTNGTEYYKPVFILPLSAGEI